MFKNALNQLMSIFMPSKPKRTKDGHVDIYGRVVECSDDFFHPQKFKGIPVIDVQSILKDYQPQLDKIKQHVEIGDHRKTPDGRSLYDTIYTNVIERYVEFCHMIPASEDHHHWQVGGLLLHSLEASVDSLRWAKETRPESTGYVDIDVEVRPVMNYCAWLAGLLHDAGKLMSDISVDAVEIYNPKTRKQEPITKSALSWHPAKESLIDWAKRHNVVSYSVNFLSNRIHNRHNVDSSQILQQVLHNQYAMDYLLSTPIKQKVYLALISVLSGYSTSEDFLSEAVRMGDSASISRSLGYLYDAKLGSRSMSTAQRLYRSVRHAAKDWRWNELNGQGWILGGDVFIRYSSCVEDIIKVSLQLGYSLPFDVKNVLSIMESNNITELFDNACADDRIVRFRPGECSPKEMTDIQLGKKHVKWCDLLKLRGPEVIFAESPMPFSKSGLFHLPKADVFYSITKDGILTKLPAVAKKAPVDVIKENATPPTRGSESHFYNKHVSDQAQIKESNDSNAKKTDSKSRATANIEVMPTSNNTNKGLSGIQFSNKPGTLLANTNAPKQARVINHNINNSRNRYSIELQSIIASNPTYIMDGDHVIVATDNIPLDEGDTLKDIISKLDKFNELEMNLNQPTIKTVMRKFGDKKQKCLKLTKQASKYFKDNTRLESESDSYKQTGLPNCSEEHIGKQSSTSYVALEQSQQQVSNFDFERTHSTYISKELDIALFKLFSLSTTFSINNQLYLNIDSASMLTNKTRFSILEFLEFKGYMFIDSEISLEEHIKYFSYQGKQCLGILLSLQCIRDAFGFNKALKYSNPEVFVPEPAGSLDNPHSTDNQQLNFLIESSDKNSLIKYLSAQDLLHYIIESGLDGFYFCVEEMQADNSKKLNLSRLRSYLRDRPFPCSEKGYLLTAEELSKIQMSEVSFSD